MDPELRCPSCSRYFLSPVLLPCGHSLCSSCAVNALRSITDSTVSVRPSTTFEAIVHNEPNLEGSSSTVSGASHGGTDSDQQSIVSEADSGVVMASRAGIYAGRLPTIIFPQHILQNLTNGLACPSCRRIVALMDEKGINQLPKNKALERVLTKLVGEDMVTSIPICQLCGSRTGTPATVWCEQCGIFYCDDCRERCHPNRGPLLKHGLHPAATGADIVRQKRQNQPPVCPEHPHEIANLFCCACCVTTCSRTPNTYGQHTQQEVQILQNYCKNKKVSNSDFKLYDQTHNLSSNPYSTWHSRL
ncbi:unnamed protein product [Hymenolepis diminuta]|uniref:B box-type domain-containing protein n=1 Tax=Hymenolepis diminuta TaxID=6216 RepID=A0A0R3SUD6_HYMDI|nr:unnamed protein product [Hymenolepis diminuta]